jgi:hypothetical protein
VAGCATTTKPSPEAEEVRIITHEAATVLKCKHVGGISTLKTAAEGGMPSAHVDARNKVTKAGGNALAITTQSPTPQGGGEIKGDGYACASF